MLFGCGWLAPSVLFAAPRQVVIEIDPRAELLIDARATRRLTVLELSDVEVPSAVNGRRRPPALFLRVLGSEGGVLRIELWERGEFCGARRLAVAQASSQLGARRVALAAAELARQLRQKRLVQRDRAEREGRRKELEAAGLASRTLDGPLALRTEAFGLVLPEHELWAAGPRLALELKWAGPLRFDVGSEWLFANIADRDARLSMLGMTAGPAQRFVLGQSLDLDLGLEVGVSSVHANGVHAVDGIVGQSDTWTARLAAVARLEPRLTRNVRLFLGTSFGTMLRRMPIAFAPDSRQDVGGICFGAEIGVVLTPGGF